RHVDPWCAGQLRRQGRGARQLVQHERAAVLGAQREDRRLGGAEDRVVVQAVVLGPSLAFGDLVGVAGGERPRRDQLGGEALLALLGHRRVQRGHQLWADRDALVAGGQWDGVAVLVHGERRQLGVLGQDRGEAEPPPPFLAVLHQREQDRARLAAPEGTPLHYRGEPVRGLLPAGHQQPRRLPPVAGGGEVLGPVGRRRQRALPVADQFQRHPQRAARPQRVVGRQVAFQGLLGLLDG